MKKHKLLSLLLTCTAVLNFVSCSNVQKINILKCKNIDSFVKIDKDYLKGLLSNELDFVLVIGEEGCSTCDVIKAPLQKYIKKYEQIFYWIETSEYLSLEKEFEGKDNNPLSTLISSATIQLFNDGDLYKSIRYDKNMYYDDLKLESTLSNYIYNLPLYSLNTYNSYTYSNDFKMYKLDNESTSTLDNAINENQKINVLYTWNRCGDCKEFKKDYLYNFLIRNHITLYQFEVSYLRGQEDLTSFRAFAKDKGFSSYRNGKVPSIVNYKNQTPIKYVVYSNDIFEENDDGFYVKESFYPALLNEKEKDKISLNEKVIKYELNQISNFLRDNK